MVKSVLRPRDTVRAGLVMRATITLEGSPEPVVVLRNAMAEKKRREIEGRRSR